MNRHRLSLLLLLLAGPPAYGQEAKEGFITIALSTPITSKGLSVTVSGESIRYGKWNTVEVRIAAPGGDRENVTLPLDAEGRYTLKWDRLLEDGEYDVTATSSDGKATASARLLVLDWSQPDDEAKDLMDVTGKAFARLEARATAIKGTIAKSDAAALDAKLQEVQARLAALHTLLADLRTARAEMHTWLSSGRVMPARVAHHVTELNHAIAGQLGEAKRLAAMAAHEPFDVNVCELLNALIEACSAFSTFTNVWAKSVAAILQNIVLDKGIPKAVEVVNSGTARLGPESEWGVKEASKVYGTARIDAEGFHSRLGKAGFAGDLVQFAGEVLLRKHCGIFKGTVTHSFKMIARDGGRPWWSYGVDTESALTLRYPKTEAGGVIRMKGSLEGNATRFTFYADPTANASYRSGTGGKVQTMILKSYTPVALRSATSLHDALGFGAVARGIATPAYFYIPVDAEYDTGANTIKLFLNEAIVDFSPAIENAQFFIQWGAGLPKLRLMKYPISNARLIINATLKDRRDFAVQTDSAGMPSFSGTVTRHLGGPSEPLEHFLEFTVSARKQ